MVSLNDYYFQVSNEPIRFEVSKDVVPLKSGIMYETLKFRQDWWKVPVFNVGADVFSVELTCDNVTVRLDHQMEPTFIIFMDGVQTIYGFGDEIPELHDVLFYDIRIADELYDHDKPAHQWAMDSISRMLNVSDTAMGDMPAYRGRVQRLVSTPLVPGASYFGHASGSIYLELPDDLVTSEDAQICIYLQALDDVDVMFDVDKVAYTYGGELPDTSSGYIKLILTYLPVLAKWSIGGMRMEVLEL